ncbi:putative hydro-lyase [Gemmata sp. JC717]|uniref:putative hydro-lyase n=1 Tax=Gemmata algarum TaxID=2975278 RepID=UPI0021BAED7D|nr:putative hydro-lyase [Gemmata algarum]MDY3555047.1 putative hydro-lyase [Gemmata algarum]
MSNDLIHATGSAVRAACRVGRHTGPTPGLALGYVHANLVILPRDWAFDFLLFCQRNPKPCPLLDVTEAGDPEAKLTAPGSDLRTDLPAYRVWEHGELVAEPTEVTKYWRSDLVSFVIGCSFTFETALLAAKVPVRHIEQNVNVPMYRTNVPCKPAGRFSGPMVVSMRPLTPPQGIKATQICSRFPRAHGAPVHFGDPAAIGIRDITKPDFGDAVEVRADEVPVFWACGVTPQAALMQAKPPFAITHKPGHMFLTDLKDTDLEGE